MPAWFAQLVPALFDGLPAIQAWDWGGALYGELARLSGQVPFAVLHDWWAEALIPLAIDTSERRDGQPALHRALRDLHRRAQTGAALRPAPRGIDPIEALGLRQQPVQQPEVAAFVENWCR